MVTYWLLSLAIGLSIDACVAFETREKYCN